MTLTKWPAEFLDQMHRTGDKLADETIAVVFKNHDARGVTAYLQSLYDTHEVPKDGAALNEETIRAIDNFRTKSSALPDWKDDAKIKKGADLFQNNGLIAFTLLGCASLPELYTCGKGGTEVLGTTQKLEKHRVNRRIYETSRFVIDVMSGDTLSKKGILAAQRVRLMHAAIRFLFTYHSEKAREHIASGDVSKEYGEVLLNERWNEKWGVPIGQEHMGGTLMSFSYTIIKGLENLGIEVAEDEAEAYLHRWNVIGYVMGINEKFLLGVSTMADAKELFDIVMSRNRSRTPEEAKEGITLTRSLVKFMVSLLRSQIFLGRFLPLKPIPLSLIGLCTSEETCEILGVKLDILDRLALIPMRIFFFLFGNILGKFGKSRSIAEFLFRGMARECWKQNLFEIPEHFAQTWHLHRRHAAGRRRKRSRSPSSKKQPAQKPPPFSSGGTGGNSSSKQIIAFLAIAAVLVIGGTFYLAIRASQSPPP